MGENNTEARSPVLTQYNGDVPVVNNTEEMRIFKFESVNLEIPVNPTKIKISRVILRNFLSFEYGEINLHPRFTVITGPNGAGKSTIFHAIKFALGSNDYNERYQKWSDFIKDGTNSCYVILDIAILLETHTRIIRIKRTVSRNKSPKFFIKLPDDAKFRNINKYVLERLKEALKIDPDNLFSFMSQGDIIKIKDLNSRNICTYIEEGIGLTDLHEEILVQKSKVEKLHRDLESLEAKRENLRYLLEKLKPKLERLKKKKQLENRLRMLDDNLLWIQKKEIENKILRWKKEIKTINDEISEVNEKILKLEEDIKEREEEINHITEHKDRLHEEITAKKNELKGLNREYDQYEEHKKKMAEQIEILKEELKQLVKDNVRIKKELESVKIRKENVEKELNEIKKGIDDLEAQKEKVEKKTKKYQNTINEIEKKEVKRESLEERLNEYKEDYEAKEAAINKSMEEIEKLNKQLKQEIWFWNSKDENIEKKYTAHKEKVEKRLLDYERQLGELDNEYDKLVKEKRELTKNYYDKNMEKPSEIKEIMKLIRETNIQDKCFGPIIDYISFPANIQKVMRSIFGFKVLYAFIAVDKNTLGKLNAFRKKAMATINLYMPQRGNIPELDDTLLKNHYGVLGYLFNTIKITEGPAAEHIKKVIYSIARDTVIVKDQSVAVELIERYKLKNWFVTLDGEQIRPKKLVLESRAFIERNNKYRLKSYAEIMEESKALDEKISENRMIYNKILKKKEEDSERLKILNKRLNILAQLNHKYHLIKVRTGTKDGLIEEKNKLYNKIVQTENELTKIKEDIKLLKSKLPSNIEELQRIISEIPVKLKELKNKHDQYEVSLENIRIQYEEKNEERIRLEEKINQKNEEIKRLTGELQKQSEEFIHLVENIQKLKEEINELKENEKILKDQISQLSEELESVKEKKEKYALKIESRKLEIRVKEEHIRETERELARLNRKVKDKGAGFEFGPEQKEALMNEIERLKTELVSYRDVNDSLLTEKRDILANIEGIKKEKDKIGNEIREAKLAQDRMNELYYGQFEETLSKLEKNMNKIMADAKVGFKVKLYLEGTIDDLGVQIKTEFKEGGKSVIRILNGLSGGQSSMVGICLMISLNQLNPTPFNIYDEIDMFLDDSNVSLIPRIIYNLTRNDLQFVMLIPKRSSAFTEFADKILGITREGANGRSVVIAYPKKG